MDETNRTTTKDEPTLPVFTLKAGREIRVNGIPAWLAQDTEIRTHLGNFTAMTETPTKERETVGSER